MGERPHPELSITAYALAVDGLPDEAIAEATSRFIRGQVETHDGRFMPTPAEWAREARRQADVMRWQEQAKHYRTIPTKIDVEISDEERKRVGALMRSLANKLAIEGV